MFKLATLVAGLLLAIVMSQPAVAQVAEAQRWLNRLGLDAGPADGVAGPRTLKAWSDFARHRGLPEDAPLDAAALEELRGQQNARMPKAKGIKLEVVGDRFPSRDTYRLDAGDPTAFAVTLRPGDYDPVDYRGGSAQERQRGWSLFKQRAELSSQTLKAGRIYTVDFEVMVDNAAAGTIFQIHRGGSGGAVMLQVFPDAIRANMNEAVQNALVHQGDLFGKWLAIRIVFFPDPKGNSWIRTYVNGELTLDTSSIAPLYPMHEAQLRFGLYRGSGRGLSTTAMFRNIALMEGDQGAPAGTR